jgi:hypothetical protein
MLKEFGGIKPRLTMARASNQLIINLFKSDFNKEGSSIGLPSF